VVNVKNPERSDYLLFGGVFALANKMQSVGDKMVEGLSTKQWFLIRTLMDMPCDPPPTITQIAREVDTTRQNATKMLEVMEREGLLSIGGSDSDRRRRSVRLTETGLRHAEKTAENGSYFLNRLFDGIDPDAMDAATKVLIGMMNNLIKMQEELP
jgi:DNA-binding MarR family transcriptional regulator